MLFVNPDVAQCIKLCEGTIVMDGRKNGWMNELNGWVGWMDTGKWMDGWVGWLDGKGDRLGGWLDGQVGGWEDGYRCVDGWMHMGWESEWTNEYAYVNLNFKSF